jgi:hypothetical protein
MRHLVVVEPEVVTQLVNHGLAHLLHSLFPRAAHAIDRSTERGDLAGSNVMSCARSVSATPR